MPIPRDIIAKAAATTPDPVQVTECTDGSIELFVPSWGRTTDEARTLLLEGMHAMQSELERLGHPVAHDGVTRAGLWEDGTYLQTGMFVVLWPRPRVVR